MKATTFGLAALLALTCVPAFAGDEPMARVIPAADSSDFQSQRQDYQAKAQHEMDVWQRRIQVAGVQTQAGLARAWDATKQQWAVLQDATQTGWDRARVAFERAADRLKADWQNEHSDHG